MSNFAENPITQDFLRFFDSPNAYTEKNLRDIIDCIADRHFFHEHTESDTQVSAIDDVIDLLGILCGALSLLPIALLGVIPAILYILGKSFFDCLVENGWMPETIADFFLYSMVAVGVIYMLPTICLHFQLILLTVAGLAISTVGWAALRTVSQYGNHFFLAGREVKEETPTPEAPVPAQ